MGGCLCGKDCDLPSFVCYWISLSFPLCFNPFVSPDYKLLLYWVFSKEAGKYLPAIERLQISWKGKVSWKTVKSQPNWKFVFRYFNSTLTSINSIYVIFVLSFFHLSLLLWPSLSILLVSSHPHHPCGISDISESGDQTHSLTHTHTPSHSLQSSSWSLRQY